MIYRTFQDIRLSNLGFGAMRRDGLIDFDGNAFVLRE